MGTTLVHSMGLLAARPGDLMGPLAIVAVLAAVGLALLLLRGSKFGWIFIVAAGLYAFYALGPIVQGSRTNPRSRAMDGVVDH